MGEAALKYKHIRMDQEKIDRVKKIFHTTTDTEAVDKALEFVLGEEKINRTLKSAGGKGHLRKVFK
jgi:Arc/MetJ family transcription regulator